MSWCFETNFRGAFLFQILFRSSVFVFWSPALDCFFIQQHCTNIQDWLRVQTSALIMRIRNRKDMNLVIFLHFRKCNVQKRPAYYAIAYIVIFLLLTIELVWWILIILRPFRHLSHISTFLVLDFVSDEKNVQYNDESLFMLIEKYRHSANKAPQGVGDRRGMPVIPRPPSTPLQNLQRRPGNETIENGGFSCSSTFSLFCILRWFENCEYVSQGASVAAQQIHTDFSFV